MLILNSTWNVLPGYEVAVRHALTDLVHQVQAGEPDTWMYLVHAANTDPDIRAFPPPSSGTITFIEGFPDEAAFKKHISGPILTAFIQKHGDSLLNMYGTSTPFLLSQKLTTASGFIRPAAVEPDLYTVIARWNIKSGSEAAARSALHSYVAEVQRMEPETFYYTANIPHQAPDLLSFPTASPSELVFNSGWKDHAAFVRHTQAAPYKDFLAQHGRLFLQVNGAPTTNQPYMTTAVLKRIAGFFRPEAFISRH